ncbi:MAG: hypothetical protein K8H86_06825 [Ignavibacteriaceae bacterium]|nr:hypothetical protein [Ignavibacteriaceae bacterium]
MRKQNFIFILFILCAGFGFADSTFVSPSVYYTYGSYSDTTKTNAVSFYNTWNVLGSFYLINHYELLNIDNPAWKYKQQTFLAGGLHDFFPVVLKYHYAHYRGEYDYKPYTDKYTEYTNLYNVDASYYYETFYFGAAFTYQYNFGVTNKVIRQLTLRLEKIISYPLFVSIKPNYTKDHEGNNLYSVAAKIHYLADDRLLLKAGGFAGKRAFYFDSDLLTIYNQPDIQKYQYFMLAEYFPSYKWKLTAAYQHTKFSFFSVDYFTLGVKANLFL